GSVQPLHVARRNQVHVRLSLNHFLFSGNEFGLAITAMVAGSCRSVSLNDLAVVYISAECILYRIHISIQAICGDLDLHLHARGNILHEGIRCSYVPLANAKGRDELRFGIDSAKGPYAANAIVLWLDVLLFLADKAPNLIHLQTSARQVTHLLIHQGRATLPNLHAKPHDRIPMNASHALHRTDARPLRKGRDDCDLLVGIEDVCHCSLLMYLMYPNN